jgi:Tfp pilus assembly protein PilE
MANPRSKYLWSGLAGLIALGFLAAIAIPSPIGSPPKSRKSEAKTYVGSMKSMNRVQQTHILQRRSFLNFEDMLSQELNIPAETDYYSYSVIQQDQELAVQQIAQAKQEDFKSYTGLTWVILFDDFETGDFQSLQVACESDEPSTDPVPAFETVLAEASPSEVDCPPGFSQVN